MFDTYSVLVQDVVKRYGKKPILKNLCMKVEEGQIYGLLGSSGCGKTTLLSAIVGRKRVESGDIWVLGGRPGEPGSGIPGRKVGYMPQETALVREFTVKDAIYYFGRIFNLEETRIEERFKELTELLNLPPSNRYLKNCSGGQQRRVSFAVALVHSPKLLILDEPTVGIDPLLREKIWSHLLDITYKQKLSVIITTHYIEECRQADKIGLMRDGKIMTEDSPNNLLKMYKTQTLEEVFFLLSQKQEAEKVLLLNQSTSDNNGLEKIGTIPSLQSIQSLPDDYKSTDVLTKKKLQPKFNIMDKNRMKALLNKNTKQFYRNTTAVAFLLLMPIIQVLLLMNSLGLDMKNIPIGIVNDESMSAFCQDFSFNGTTEFEEDLVTCHFHNLSCRFLTYLAHPMFRKVEYRSLEEATNDVTHGIVYGVMYISQNFSSALEQKLDDGFDVEEDILELSQIKVRLDMSNQQVGISVKNKLIDLFMDFQEALYEDCNIVKSFGALPVKTEFFYGSKDEPYQVFILPGIIVTMMFFFGSLMTSQIMVTEKQEGIWDRSIVAGVTAFELTISHLMFQSFIAIFQCLEMLGIAYGIYQYSYKGSIVLIYFIVYFQGICGMSYGMLISIVCSNAVTSSNAVMGFYLPMIIISGIIWPVQGMPKGLQLISRILPVAEPIESMHHVVKRGLSIDDLRVAKGFGASVGWIFIFGILSLIFLKMQR